MTKTRAATSTQVEPPRPAGQLEPARMESDLELEGVVITEQDVSDGGVFDLSLDGSRLERCRMTGAVFERLSLKDCELVDCELSGTFLKNVEAERVQFTRCRMTGAVMTSAAMHHVRFVECLMQGVNLRMAEGLVLAFDACDLREVDMYAGNLTNSTFTSCDLTGAELSNLRLEAARSKVVHSSTYAVRSRCAAAPSPMIWFFPLYRRCSRTQRSP